MGGVEKGKDGEKEERDQGRYLVIENEGGGGGEWG